jgi:hypothetical protein
MFDGAFPLVDLVFNKKNFTLIICLVLFPAGEKLIAPEIATHSFSVI